jgi:hypothetical protein
MEYLNEDILINIFSNIQKYSKIIILLKTSKQFTYKLFTKISMLNSFKKLYRYNNLKLLNLHLSDINSLSYINSLKYLKILNISCCVYIKDFSYLSKLTLLEHLDISYLWIKNIEHLPTNLKKLYMNRCDEVIDFKPLLRLYQLEKLDLSYTRFDNFDYIPSCVNTLYVYSCPKLEIYPNYPKYIVFRN